MPGWGSLGAPAAPPVGQAGDQGAARPQDACAGRHTPLRTSVLRHPTRGHVRGRRTGATASEHWSRCQDAVDRLRPPCHAQRRRPTSVPSALGPIPASAAGGALEGPVSNIDHFRHRPVSELAVLPDEDAARRVIEDLRGVGVDIDEARVLHGHEGARILDRTGREHGFFSPSCGSCRTWATTRGSSMSTTKPCAAARRCSPCRARTSRVVS